MWRSTLISKKYPPKFVYLMLKVTRRHIYTLRDSLDPLVKAATLLRLFSLPNGVFHLKFSNKKHYNLVLTTHLRYKKKSFSYLHLPSTTIIFLYLPSSTVIFLYPHSSHLPSSAFIYLYLLSFPFIDLHPLSSSFTWHILPLFTFIEIYLCAFIVFFSTITDIHRPLYTSIYLSLQLFTFVSSFYFIIFILALIYLFLKYFIITCLIVLYRLPLPLFAFIYLNFPQLTISTIFHYVIISFTFLSFIALPCPSSSFSLIYLHQPKIIIICLHLPSTAIRFLHLPSFALITLHYYYLSSSAFLCFHLPLLTVVYFHLSFFTFRDLHLPLYVYLYVPWSIFLLLLFPSLFFSYCHLSFSSFS